ncbi:MAG TPA: sulfurtransferase [Candidatus Dormibacteraeota bacterium]|jgi:thiosulfate/3-mercaptopyruvate sulfurtransferase|nr:sulfurtransferase [Candidatus Dormibacteraeota bacterium]
MADGSNGYANPGALVSTAWLAEHLKDPGQKLIEVDVDPSNYAKGHIEGAVGWDWKKDLQDATTRDLPASDALASRLGESGVGSDDTILLYGDSNNWFAAYAYWALKYFGHENVKLVDGGRVKWEAEGRSLSTEVPSPQASGYKFPNQPREDLRAYREDVLAGIGKVGLIDVRSPAEFSGQLLAPENLPQEGAQRGGHIPSALNVPWATAVAPDGTFKSAEELREIYVGKGLSPEREVIAYCRIGERSAHTWFVLKELLGIDKVRNYDGSWTEWGSAVRVPIEK